MKANSAVPAYIEQLRSATAALNKAQRSRGAITLPPSLEVLEMVAKEVFELAKMALNTCAALKRDPEFLHQATKRLHAIEVSTMPISARLTDGEEVLREIAHKISWLGTPEEKKDQENTLEQIFFTARLVRYELWKFRGGV